MPELSRTAGRRLRRDRRGAAAGRGAGDPGRGRSERSFAAGPGGEPRRPSGELQLQRPGRRPRRRRRPARSPGRASTGCPPGPGRRRGRAGRRPGAEGGAGSGQPGGPAGRRTAGGGSRAGAGGRASCRGRAREDGPISLGTATVEQLDTIDGIGPVTAEDIVEFRDQHGGLASVDQLDQVSGIGPATMESLRRPAAALSRRGALAAPSLPVLLGIAVLVVAGAGPQRRDPRAGRGGARPRHAGPRGRAGPRLRARRGRGHRRARRPRTSAAPGSATCSRSRGQNVTLLALLAMPLLAPLGMPLRARLVWVLGPDRRLRAAGRRRPLDPARRRDGRRRRARDARRAARLAPLRAGCWR